MWPSVVKPLSVGFFCLFQSSIALIFTSLLSDSGAEMSHKGDSQARGINFVLFLLNLVHIDVLHKMHANVLHAV